MNKNATENSTQATPNYIAKRQARINQVLESHLPATTDSPEDLHKAMSYMMLAKGKRLRPLLVYAAGESLGATSSQLDIAASSVEMIHTYSLIHDDLPAMDDDDMRRGQPSCHKHFGESTAILAGNALQNLAFQMLAEDTTKTGDLRLSMITTLTQACGSQGILGGQILDLNIDEKTLALPQLENIHYMKTAALIIASVKLGALAAGCSDIETFDQLDQFGKYFGLAFQMEDDFTDQAEDHLNYSHVVSRQEAEKRLSTLYKLTFNALDTFSKRQRCFLHDIVDYSRFNYD